MGKAVLLVEIDLIHKGIKTPASVSFMTLKEFVEIDLIHKGIKTSSPASAFPKRCAPR